MKQTPLPTFKLKLFGLLCAILRLPFTPCIRFIPDGQKRLDTRGRTVAIYESFRDAMRDLQHIHDHTYTTKEPEHGQFYLALEIRSAFVHRLGAGRKNSDTHTQALPFSVPQGLPGPAGARSPVAAAEKAAHDEQGTGRDHGEASERFVGQKADRPAEPVGRVKVNLSDIGVR